MGCRRLVLDANARLVPYPVRAETPEEVAMRVDQLMSRNVVTVGIDESCDQALSRMLRSRVRHLPVLDGGGNLRGVLTDRDLRHQPFAPGVLERIGHRGAMSAPAICLGATAEIDEAAVIMRRHRIGSVPVLDAAKVVGILTETDLLRTSRRCRDVLWAGSRHHRLVPLTGRRPRGLRHGCPSENRMTPRLEGARGDRVGAVRALLPGRRQAPSGAGAEGGVGCEREM